MQKTNNRQAAEVTWRQLAFMVSVLITLCFILSGCKSNPDEKKKELSRSKYSILTEPAALSVSGETDINKALTKEQVISPTLPPSGGNEIINPPDAPVATDAGNGRSKLYGKVFSSQKSDEKIKVMINFDAAGLGDIVPAFSQSLGFDYILDPAVKGTVTMSVESEMKPESLWNLFEQILWMTGSYGAFEEGIVHIRPINKMAQERGLNAKDSNVEAVLIPLRYAAVKDIVSQIKPFLSDAAAAIALDEQNAVLLIESPGTIERLRQIIIQLDQRPRANWFRTVINCRNITPSQLQNELTEIMPILGFPVEVDSKDKSSGAISLVALDRMQILIASAVTQEALDELRKTVLTLDRSDVGEQERVFLYQVQNSKADELLQALSTMFHADGSSITVSSGTNAGASSKTSTSNTGNANNNKSNIKQKNSAIQEKSASIFDVPVKIFADAVKNRLIIRTTPRTYAMIRALLERIDTVTQQVLLQVLVVEIELTDTNEFGMEFSDAVAAGATKSIFGTNYESLKPAVSQTGATYHIFNPSNPSEKFGYIRALAAKSNLRVLSSPQLLVASHADAKVSVGKRVPTVSGEVTDTASSSTTGTSLVRNYQYVETGVILTVTPHIFDSGQISMSLEQTISDVMETAKAVDTPTIKESVLSTTLTLHDGRTLIMGGLIKEKHDSKLNSIPYLAEIPILNWLIGDSSMTYERTEILLLITATIIREETRLEELIRSYSQAVKEIDKFENRLEKNREKEDKKTWGE
jgi:general secretion pathway protein D